MSEEKRMSTAHADQGQSVKEEIQQGSGSPAKPSGATGSAKPAITVNVSSPERKLSVALGAVLVGTGFLKRVPGMLLAGSELVRRGITGHSFLYQLMGRKRGIPDRQAETSAPDAGGKVEEVERSLTIRRSPAELYDLWRDPANFALVMAVIGDVTATSEGRSRWVFQPPLGPLIQWESEITEERPGESLRWASLPGSVIPNEGFVRFVPATADRGTVVTLRMRFDPPGGVLGKLASKASGQVPELVVGKALRRFQNLVEAGEIPTLQTNPSARGRGDAI